MAFLSNIPTPVWVALCDVISGIGARLVSESKINASFEPARIKTIAKSLTGEAAFRAKMMAKIAIVRGLVKMCESGRDARQRGFNRSAGRALAGKALNEDMVQPVVLLPDDKAPPSIKTNRAE